MSSVFKMILYSNLMNDFRLKNVLRFENNARIIFDYD